MIGNLFEEIIKQNVSADGWNWLAEKVALVNKGVNAAQLNIAFATVPGKTGKKPIEISAMQEKKIDVLLPGFSIRGWTTDRLSRVWLLMNLNSADKDDYIRRIENLFKAAEMNELVALYSSLPLLAYPDAWKFRCTEGIRSNIGTVLEAIMYENPYPSGYLDEPGWNQMVLKAFFTEKNVERITGLDQRANKRLASILCDYAHERWAAHRVVNPQLWRLVGKFIDENNFSDILKLFNSGNPSEKKAAALALSESDFMPAKDLLNQTTNLKNAISEKTLSWNSLVKEMKNFSSN
ncbi:MAG TPA: EboA domain-containing protein [Chitinophagaceae bacterium]|jgi:hypothetical protein